MYYIIGAVVFISSASYYYFFKKNDAISFIPDKEHVISILDVKEVTGEDIVIDNDTRKNIINYLLHHFNDHNVKFEDQRFQDPIIVRFKCINQVYRICLKCLKTTRENCSVVKKDPFVISAKITSDNREITITNMIKELHGPYQNYNYHIPDVIKNLEYFFQDYQGEKIEILDIMGKKTSIEL